MTGLTRRSFLAGAAGLAAPLWALGQAPPSSHGRVVPPLPLPDLEVTRHDGVRTRLAALTDGKVTALHLMFTRCPSTCPIQAAIFQRVQTLLREAHTDAQLLSLSVDPKNDTPEALAAWLREVGAGEGWAALRPHVADLPVLQGVFGARSSSADSHSTQVSVIDRRSRVVWRSIELPAPEEIVAVLKQV